MTKKIDFEKSIAELESIIDALESGQLPLEKAITKYEEGMKLSHDCNKLLTEAEQKITTLSSSFDPPSKDNTD